VRRRDAAKLASQVGKQLEQLATAVAREAARCSRAILASTTLMGIEASGDPVLAVVVIIGCICLGAQVHAISIGGTTLGGHSKENSVL